MRLYTHFTIEEEQDSTALVHLIYAKEILTKDIIPYEESILDSIGNAPVKITKYWTAHGFLNFEFLYSGRYHITETGRHMINLLLHPIEDRKVKLEFRHNDFEDFREKIYSPSECQHILLRKLFNHNRGYSCHINSPFYKVSSGVR